MVAVVFMFLLGSGVVLGAYYALTTLPARMEQRRLDQRLGEISHTKEDEEKSIDLLKTRDEGPLPAIERMLGGTTRGTQLGRWIEQSGVKISISSLALYALSGAAVCGMVAYRLMRMNVGWFIGGAIGFAIPFFVLNFKRKRRLRRFEEEFPEALDLIARALKAGHAFATGLKMVADEMSEPIGPEFRKTFDEQNFGLPLKDALNNLTERIPLLDVRFFATAVLIQRETGGNLSEILENLAHVVRERFKILRQVRVYTAHGRLTGYVLLALPVFLVIALSFINPEHMQLLFRERIGHMLLGATVVMQTIGYFWIRQVVKIEV
ncbi:MAG TPA: type II secretion system F family protein [Vicinamibacterales bacterium]|jgi:tight adherence protein B|nr:type II secretion system F family protein [Vicinamibacterales bacterium]